MRNKFLLLGATALLSTTAMMANATDGLNLGSADLEVYATMVKPAVITANDCLGFGVMRADAGKKVVVTTEGALGDGTDAMMFSSTKSPQKQTSFQAGKVTITGKAMGTDISTFNQYFDINIDEEIPLKYNNDIMCGTVGSFQKSASITGTETDSTVVVKIGGTLTINLADTIYDPVPCSGKATVTLIQKGGN